MKLNHHVIFETAKALNLRGFRNVVPAFGDIYYAIHPDTGEVETVLVGSAKWNLVQSHELYFAPSAIDLLQAIGPQYNLTCIGGANWVVEKEISTSFDDDYYEYVTEYFPLENNGNPAEALSDVIISLDLSFS